MVAAAPQDLCAEAAPVFCFLAFLPRAGTSKEVALITIERLEQDLQAADAAAERLSQDGVAALLRPTGAGKGTAARKLIEKMPEVQVFWLTHTAAQQARRQAEAARLWGSVLQRVRFFCCPELQALDAKGWVELVRPGPGLVVVDGWRDWTAVQWTQCIEKLRSFCPEAKLLGLASPDQPVTCWAAEELFHAPDTMTLPQAMAAGRVPAPAAVLPLLWPADAAEQAFQRQAKNLHTPGQPFPSKKQQILFAHAVERVGSPAALLAETLPQGASLVLCETEAARSALSENVSALFGPETKAVCLEEGVLPEAPAQRGRVLYLAVAGAVLPPLNGLAGAVLVRTTAAPETYRRLLAETLAVCGSVPVAELCAQPEGLESARILRQEQEALGGQTYPVAELSQPVARAARQLQRNLDAQWEAYYAAAKAAAAKGPLHELTRTDKAKNGLALGRWLEVQRQIRAGERPGRLTPEQIAKLEKLGIVWKQRLELAWERGYASAQKYRAAKGDLLVPVRYRDKNGFALGEWIVYNRQRRLGGGLSADRIERLQALGMVWDTAEALWEQNYAAAVCYYRATNGLEIPVKYITPGGLALGVWLGSQRTAYKEGTLTTDQITRLEALGVDWSNRNDRKWQAAYEAAVRYHAAHGDLNVPAEYVDPDGVLLGKWISRQRYAWQNPDRSSAKVTPERKALLDALGMVWEKPDSWQHRYEMAAAYKAAHGSLEIPAQYRTEEGVWLGSWVSRQKQLFRREGHTMSPERRRALQELFKGEAPRRSPAVRPHCSVREQNWLDNYHRARVYAKRRGDLLVPASFVDETGFRLGVWISNLRAARKTRPSSFQVTPEHIRLLDEIGMQWDAREAKWQCALRRAEEYRAAHGDLLVPVNYKTADGFCLGDWIRRMRESYAARDEKLTSERVVLLNALGMRWTADPEPEKA